MDIVHPIIVFVLNEFEAQLAIIIHE